MKYIIHCKDRKKQVGNLVNRIKNNLYTNDVLNN